MEIKEKISLKEYSTFRIGGEAEFFCVVKEQKDLIDAIDFAKRNNLEIFFLGGGSNILFPSGGFSGLVVKIENELLKIAKEFGNKTIINCGAGVSFNKLASFAVKNSLTGLEWATGIPGTVGGAIRGNAGAYGKEIKENVFQVFAIDTKDKELKVHQVDLSTCGFEYRSSAFKENSDLLVWEVELELEKGDAERIKQTTKEIIQKRNGGQPSVGLFPSVGCIFKNPVVEREVIEKFEFDSEQKSRENKVPAGWLIDRCDLKGERIGDAMVDKKQANFIVNMGNATSEDVIILMSLIKMKVRNKFNVQLEEEVKILI
jgi:UDP-N-acetylmuramate dehydrogenase